MIEVLKPGLQTTVQDAGRPGHLGQGIPPGGPQDHYSFAAASLLVGNDLPPSPLSLGDPGQAGLETTLVGPTLKFGEPALIAITGAEAEAKLDGEPVPLWTAVEVDAGGVLEIGQAERGARGYLAVAGGIDVPPDLGSRATYLVGARGGLDGRALEKGDALPVGEPRRPIADLAGQSLDPALRTRFDRRPEEVRVVLGPQDFRFTEHGVATFLEEEFRLTMQANRMGFRFEGPPLELEPRPDYLVRDAGSGAADIVDDVIPVGGIQVPAGSEVIVLGVEAPSAGGYAKIATVISSDFGRVGQLVPQSPVRFRAVEQEEAVEIGRDQVAALTDALMAEAS